jgi:acyl carrier protein
MAQTSRQQIHAKVVELARQLGRDASRLSFDEEIPAAGLLDSAAIMELILWFEDENGIAIPQEHLTLANLGTIDAMSAYVERAGRGSS